MVHLIAKSATVLKNRNCQKSADNMFDVSVSFATAEGKIAVYLFFKINFSKKLKTKKLLLLSHLYG